MAMNRERRRFERIDRNFRLQFSRFTELPSSEPSLDGELLDIGGGGLRFRSQHHVSENEQLLIVLEVPGWRVRENRWEPTESKNDIGVLQVIGRVLWKRENDAYSRKYEVGVAFTGVLT